MTEAENFALQNRLFGPRIAKPPHLTDAQFIAWYGASKSKSGMWNYPMSTAHLFPKGSKR